MTQSQEQPSQSLIAFDFDGVIIDSRAAVRRAYREAGVTMPYTSWGLPWQEWLIGLVPGGEAGAREVHRRKKQLYADELEAGVIKWLSGAVALEALSHTPDVHLAILTGASRSAVNPIIRRLGLELSPITIGTGMTEHNKIDMLRSMRKNKTPSRVVYVDDKKPVGSRISTQSRSRFVHFQEQTPDELMRQIWTQ